MRKSLIFALILVVCLAVSLVGVVYPIYVIRPFRHQGASELAVALAVSRFRPAITVISGVDGGSGGDRILACAGAEVEAGVERRRARRWWWCWRFWRA